MNTDQLIKFLTIVKQRSMSKAASVLYVTPSALSHSIQSLEEELGTTLFIRNKKGIILTASGEILYKYASKIDELSTEALNAVKNTSLITISSNHPSATFVLSRIPDECFERVSLIHHDGKEMPELLLKGIADAVVCDDYYIKQAFASGVLNASDVSRMVVYKETLGLFVPEGHELYNRSRITYTEIKDMPLCIQMNRLSLREWLSNIEMASGVSFNIKFTLDEYSYTNFRNKIPLPELREVNSLFDPKVDPTLKNYKFVRVNDFYSNRFIYMWYQKSKEEKLRIVLDSITGYYIPSN
ncbi:MAG: LysR family transcriptional regulator [Firmicutes bacterium]|nr:LysR family transcriptional regulator [Bacillota bacterium]